MDTQRVLGCNMRNLYLSRGPSVRVVQAGWGVQMNRHLNSSLNTCMFSSVHVQFTFFSPTTNSPPLCSCSVHVQFTPPPRSDFLRYPEGQTTNVLFLEIFTRATPDSTPHQGWVFTFLKTRAPQLSIPVHLSLARTQLHPIRPRTHAHRFRQVLYQGHAVPGL